MYGEQGRSAAAPDMHRTARSSILCGIMMLAAWILPLLGIPLGIAGLTMGITGLSSSRCDLARAGIFLNGLGLSLAALNMFLAFYLLSTGKLDPLLMFQ
jgi:hypothetical protein